MGFMTDLLKKFTGPDIDLKQLVSDGAMIVDVRSPAEFAQGHVDGAVNIPHTAVGASISRVARDKAQCIIVYCASGARSGAARGALQSAGYTNVTNGRTLGHMRRALG